MRPGRESGMSAEGHLADWFEAQTKTLLGDVAKGFDEAVLRPIGASPPATPEKKDDERRCRGQGRCRCLCVLGDACARPVQGQQPRATRHACASATRRAIRARMCMGGDLALSPDLLNFSRLTCPSSQLLALSCLSTPPGYSRMCRQGKEERWRWARPAHLFELGETTCRNAGSRSNFTGIYCDVD